MEELADAIDELVNGITGEEELTSSLGIKNLDYLKKKLFDPEFEYVMKAFDEKIKEGIFVMRKEFETLAYQFNIDVKEKIMMIETLASDFENSQKRNNQYGSAITHEYEKLCLKMDKIQAMFQLMESKVNKIAENSLSESKKIALGSLPVNAITSKSRNSHLASSEVRNKFQTANSGMANTSYSNNKLSTNMNLSIQPMMIQGVKQENSFLNNQSDAGDSILGIRNT
jgi:hypothetical protein